MDVEYVKERLEQDPMFQHKLFKEACARYFAVHPWAKTIEAKIGRDNTEVYIAIDGNEVTDDAFKPTSQRAFWDDDLPITCRGCGRDYEPKLVAAKGLVDCENCGCAL